MGKTGYLFAGQGAQYAGMGKDLYDNFPESKKVFDQADEILGFSVSELCFEGPEEELKQTRNCQPAIVTMSVAAWEAFKAVTGHKIEAGSFAAGLSLGEYTALVVSGALRFEDAVSLVKLRGEFMEEDAVKNPGKMLSIIGLNLEAVRKICLETDTQIANINCPGQIVISGGFSEIQNAAGAAQTAGARRAIMLEVSGAFHSSFMKGASRKLAEVLSKITIYEPTIPCISNVTALPMTSSAEIKDNLVKQVSSSVLWEDSMRFILSQGISTFYEFGPGRVLKGLMRRIDEAAVVTNIEKKDDIINLMDNKNVGCGC